ncbi:DNA sulfur modification protein DndB [Lysinibacillus sp. NPDC097279]|uniref:DNA sulfur modification protein DndB n=1 Tax=Lysinibacillus sp. NPDC097279 TaxID=3364143 RepID=UPI0037F62E70
MEYSHVLLQNLAGVVVLPIDYEFECLDVNHRTVAIRELAEEAAEYIGESHLLLNIVFERDTKKIRQDFVDVNKNAKQTSSSINTLFNTRDKVSNLVVDLIEIIPYLDKTTELLSTSVSKNSHNIYTINNLKNAVIEIAGYNSQTVKSEKVSKELTDDLEMMKSVKDNSILFFEELQDNEYIRKAIMTLIAIEGQEVDTIPEIRNESILTSGTGIIVAARVAGYFVKEAQNPTELKSLFRKIAEFDWSRENRVFSNSIIGSDKKILNSRDAITAATNSVLSSLGYTI